MATNYTLYAVMHKETRQLFVGFDADQQPTWTDEESKARSYARKHEAHGQALLFMSLDIKTQQRPVALLARNDLDKSAQK